MTFVLCDTVEGTACEDCCKNILLAEALIREDGIFGSKFRCLPCGKKAILKEFEKLNKLYARINSGNPFFYVTMDEASNIDTEKLEKLFNANKEISQKILEEQR